MSLARQICRGLLPLALLAIATGGQAAGSRELDPALLSAEGLRKIEGRHLVLYTDLPPSADVDALPGIFDQAYPQWCAYFGLPEQTSPPWQANGFLMKDREKFVRAEAIPEHLRFLHGFAIDLDLWLYEQPNAYYRRHLLLHEGTHSFMLTRVGGSGPPWYYEGMAELLGTHRLVDGKLQLGYFPASREEVPELGRIKLVRDTIASGRPRSLDDVLNYGPTAHLVNEPYAWCWALAALLDGQPSYRARFRQLPADVAKADFNDRFRKLFAADWDQLNDQWEVFTASLEHGHDLVRSAIEFAPGEALPAGGARVKIAADRSWQSSRLRLEKGTRYRLRASGRYQLATQPRIWWSEPGGVSIRYYNGRPLGILLGAVRPDQREPGTPSALVKPLVIGLGSTLVPETSGTLYLKINDSPAELADNSGSLELEIVKE